MRVKIIGLMLITAMFVGVEYKINKCEIMDIEVVKVKQNPNWQKKSEEELELEYWSNKLGRKVEKVTKVKAKLSFYTDLDIENYEGCNGKTASGCELYNGVAANNMYAIGTDLYFDRYGEYEILDRGGKGLSTYNNFDVYVARNYGESDERYYKRVNDMGVKKVDGYIFE